MVKLFLTFITVMLCTGCGSQVSPPTALATAESVLDVQAMKSKLGIGFIPAKTSDIVKAKVPKEEAIAKAQESGAPVQEASAIFAELGYFSDLSLETAATSGEKANRSSLVHPLVWIISCEGVHIPSSGPPESTHTVAHEYNVVINAMTGDYIMGFVYR